MRLRNRDGTPVDPVPFLVVVLGVVMVCYSYGPIYLMALGFGLGDALLASGTVVTLATGASYHRLVWTATPEARAEVPAGLRLRRLLYAVAVGVAVLLLLALPLFVRS